MIAEIMAKKTNKPKSEDDVASAPPSHPPVQKNTYFASVKDFSLVSIPAENTNFIKPDGTLFCQLSLGFFGWIAKRFKEKKMAREMGHLDTPTYTNLKNNFDELKSLMVKLFGAVQVEKEIQSDNLFRLPEVAMYASESCYRWYSINPDEIFQKDLLLGGTVFRKVSTEHYAWLRHRLANLQTANPAIFESIRPRFNLLYRECAGRFTEEILARAFKALDLARYRPMEQTAATWQIGSDVYQEAIGSKIEEAEQPTWVGFLYPPETEMLHFWKVDPKVLEKLEAIKDKVVALGWKEEDLFQNRSWCKFPCGDEYGVAPHLIGDDEIVEIDGHYLEVKNKLGGLSRFLNPAFIRDEMGKDGAGKEEAEEEALAIPASFRKEAPGKVIKKKKQKEADGRKGRRGGTKWNVSDGLYSKEYEETQDYEDI